MPIEYATEATLRSLGTRLNESLEKSVMATASKRPSGSATFLSHSTKDADQLPGVIKILTDHGADVYIDKVDSSLPPYTSRETAKILRDRISASKKFVLFASNNSKDSRWVPWELGLADGYKHPRNVAIFPSVTSQNDTKWTTQEYLGVYDRVVFGDLQGFQSRVWMVYNQAANEATELRTWITKDA